MRIEKDQIKTLAVLLVLAAGPVLADDSGYPEGGYQALVEEVAGADFSDFFDRYIVIALKHDCVH